MKLCFDTNVLIDIWGRTEDFYYSYASLDVALVKQFEPYIAASTTTDIVYLLSSRNYLSRKQARKTVEELFVMFEVFDVTSYDCRNAFESEMKDYEDALIAHAAQRNGVDFIITRNKRDFLKSPVPALTPEEFVKIYIPENIEYDMLTAGTFD